MFLVIPRSPQNRRLSESLVWLSIGLVLFLGLRTLVDTEEADLEFAFTVIQGQLRTPLLTIRTKEKPESRSGVRHCCRISALLIHGISASKSARCVYPLTC
jgi:hypothetical protein